MVKKFKGNFLISRYLNMSVEQINKLDPFEWELLVSELQKRLKNK